MSRESTLTATSRAVLGLLAIRPWSSYELTKQMDRSLGRIWPRAESKLYDEPKKLAEHGLARATTETVGRRPRTVYTITARGRRELARWLGEPGGGPVIEFDGLLKLFFADSGSSADALATLAGVRDWAAERNQGNLAAARGYLAGDAPFAQRTAINSLVGGFLTEFYAMVAEWADHAATIVQTWPEDPADAEADRVELRRIVGRASWSDDQPTPR